MRDKKAQTLRVHSRVSQKKPDSQTTYRIRQQAAIARLSQMALQGIPLTRLLKISVRLLAKLLSADFAEVLQLTNDQKQVVFRAEFGWGEDVVLHKTALATGKRSQAGVTLLSRSPVIVTNLKTEIRFSVPPLLKSHHVMSGMSVVIEGPEEPYGVLAVHTVEERKFSLYDINFTQSVANIIGMTLIRLDSEKKVLDSEKRFRSILENSHDAVRLIDFSGEVLYVSPSVQRILGYTPDEYKKINFFKLIHPDDKKIYRRVLEKSQVHPNKSYGLIYRLRHKNGSWRWMEGIGKSMLHDPSVRAVVSNFRDITDRMKIEQELRESAERLLIADQRKDEFMSMVSHELKTPITSLKLFTGILERQVKKYSDVKMEQTVKRTKYQIEKMSEIISDLLDISRIQTGKMQLKMENFRLDQLVSDTIAGLEGMSGKHQLVPKRLEPVRVTADRFRLYQVITNFITNAVKYSPDANKVIINVYQKGEQAVVSIKDYGIGIPKKQQKMIFDKLYQVQSSHNAITGLGMGLYISKEIIRAHNGVIWVESSSGKGSTFYFSLPCDSGQQSSN